MSKSAEQNLKNHARLDPWYHLFLSVVLFANIIVALVFLVRFPGFVTAWFVVVSIAGFVALLKIRLYPMKVQDRVIRLEERLRLYELAPAEWRGQIGRLSEDQLIGLRFASDEEVVELAKQALAENLTRKQIKRRIRNWRADEWRV